MITKLLSPSTIKFFVIACMVYFLQGNLECRKTVVFHHNPHGFNVGLNQVANVVQLSTSGRDLRQFTYGLSTSTNEENKTRPQIAELNQTAASKTTAKKPLLKKNNN